MDGRENQPTIRVPVCALVFCFIFCARPIPEDRPLFTLDVLTAIIVASTANSSGSGSGSSTKLTFVTASSHNGNFDNDAGLTGGGAVNANGNGVEEADRHCMVDGNYPGSGTYKALLADGTNRIACTSANCSGGTGEHTDWVLGTGVSYYRSDGTSEILTTDTNGVFVFGTLTNSFGTGGPNFWTGLAADWTAAANDCTDWGSAAGTGQSGNEASTTSSALAVASPGCGGSLRLVCVEQ